MIKKIERSLFAKVLIVTVILLVGMSFLVYMILAWYTPKTYSNNLNAALDEQTQKFILGNSSDRSKKKVAKKGGTWYSIGEKKG